MLNVIDAHPTRSKQVIYSRCICPACHRETFAAWLEHNKHKRCGLCDAVLVLYGNYWRTEGDPAPEQGRLF